MAMVHWRQHAAIQHTRDVLWSWRFVAYMGRQAKACTRKAQGHYQRRGIQGAFFRWRVKHRVNVTNIVETRQSPSSLPAIYSPLKENESRLQKLMELYTPSPPRNPPQRRQPAMASPVENALSEAYSKDNKQGPNLAVSRVLGEVIGCSHTPDGPMCPETD